MFRSISHGKCTTCWCTSRFNTDLSSFYSLWLPSKRTKLEYSNITAIYGHDTIPMLWDNMAYSVNWEIGLRYIKATSFRFMHEKHNNQHKWALIYEDKISNSKCAAEPSVYSPPDVAVSPPNQNWPPSLFALAFRSELQYCYGNGRINSGDNAKMMNFGSVTPEFERVECGIFAASWPQFDDRSSFWRSEDNSNVTISISAD